MCDKKSLRSACAYAQSDQSLCMSLEYSITVMLLTEHRLEFLSLKGGCTGLSESTLVKMSNCWKSHAAAQIMIGPVHWVNYKSLGKYQNLLFPCPSFSGLNPELTKQPEAQENKKCWIISCPLVLCIYKRM